MRLNDDQIREVQNRLDQGMSPEDIGNFFGRVADLDDADVASVRNAAQQLLAERSQQDEH